MTSLVPLILLSCLALGQTTSPDALLSRTTRQEPETCEFTCTASKDCKERARGCGSSMKCRYTSDNLLSTCDCGLADGYFNLVPGVAEDATRAATPWHVGIYQARTSTFYPQICTGVLIFKDVVLTTATCMFDQGTFRQLEPQSIKVAAKQSRDYLLEDIGQQKFDVAAIKILDGYEGEFRGFSKNIALLFLSTPASRPGIHPICLHTEKEITPEMPYLKLTGWGLIPLSNYSRSKTVKHSLVTYSNIMSCINKYGTPLNRRFLTIDKFCVDFTENTNMSEEDSGGPTCLLWKGRHHLVGILSNKQKTNTNFGIATRIYRYLPWIDRQVKSMRLELECQKLSNPFKCGEGLGCVPLKAVCDGKKDCPNEADEDEKNCSDSKTGDTGDKCLVPDGLEVYTHSDCTTGTSCRATRFVSSGTRYVVSCPEGYSFAPDPRPVTTLCFQGSWNPLPPRCHRQCEEVTSTTLDLTCRYQGREVGCNTPLLPNTTVEFQCKRAYKKEEGALYRSPTQCREDGQLLYLLTDCTPQCGAVNLAHRVVPQISIGKPARPGTFPWIAALYWRKDDTFAHMCGGTIIATNKILTAAHCLYRNNMEVDDSDLMVVTGKYYRLWSIVDDFEQRFKVKRKEIAKHYDGVTGNYAQDIAVLILSSYIELNAFNAPACLDLDLRVGGIPENQLGHVAGWGAKEDGNQPATLLQTSVGYLDLEQCRKQFGSKRMSIKRFLTPDKFCIIYINGSGTQTGDSGGGLTFIHNDLHFVYGIVSIGDKESNDFAAFTNIHSHAQWLKNVLSMDD